MPPRAPRRDRAANLTPCHPSAPLVAGALGGHEFILENVYGTSPGLRARRGASLRARRDCVVKSERAAQPAAAPAVRRLGSGL